MSIQLEKVGLRDTMLNAFLSRKQKMADRMENPVSVRAEVFLGLSLFFMFEQINILNWASVASNH